MNTILVLVGNSKISTFQSMELLLNTYPINAKLKCTKCMLKLTVDEISAKFGECDDSILTIAPTSLKKLLG